LTKRIVESLKPNEHTDVFVWDSEIRGLGVRLKPSGTRTFLCSIAITHPARAASFLDKMVCLFNPRHMDLRDE
jgi:hypothetical protein